MVKLLSSIAFCLFCFPLLSKESVSAKKAAEPHHKEDSHSAEIEEKLQNWSLQELENYSVQNNSLYLAEKQNIGIARGEMITASLYRNPVIGMQNQFIRQDPLGRVNSSMSSSYLPSISQNGVPGVVQLPPATSGGPVEIAPSVNWDLDFAGYVSTRAETARHGFQAQIAGFEDFDRLFRLRLRQNYWSYLYLSELVNFQKDFYDNYNDLLHLTKFRADKGDISQLEYDRIFLEKLRIEKEVQDAEIQRVQVAKEIRFFAGIPGTASRKLKLKGNLRFFTTAELGVDLKNYDMENRPDLKAHKLRVRQSRLNVDLKKKEGTHFGPFANVGAEIRHKGNETYTGLFLTVPLKVFDRNQGEILKAEESYKKTSLELESRRKLIEIEIRTAVRELEAREELLRTYTKNRLLEKNKEVQEKSRTAYVKGASNLVTFLEAEKNYINLLKGYYEQLYLYYNAIEQFRAAVGRLQENGK
ncbi:MAG TPA: TolC family protein [Leptospiraceae bacterium]|nr:TolC family protein [Leptospiraceae bacterium]